MVVNVYAMTNNNTLREYEEEKKRSAFRIEKYSSRGINYYIFTAKYSFDYKLRDWDYFMPQWVDRQVQ